jgi:hypothetical protein
MIYDYNYFQRSQKDENENIESTLREFTAHFLSQNLCVAHTHVHECVFAFAYIIRVESVCSKKR